MHEDKDIPAERFPDRGHLWAKPKNLPAFFYGAGWICNEAIKQVFESFEPERHEFYPIKFTKGKAREPVETSHYMLYVRGLIDCLDIPNCRGITYSRRPDGLPPFPNLYLDELVDGRGDVAIHEDRVQGRHLWREKTACDAEWCFASEELFTALRKAGLNKRWVSSLRTISSKGEGLPK